MLLSPLSILFAASVLYGAGFPGDDPPPDPFKLPERLADCRSASFSPLPGLDLRVVLLTRDGLPPLERDIEAGFDSSGSPLFLLVAIHESSDSAQERAHGLMVNFRAEDGSASPTGMRASYDIGTPPPAPPNTPEGAGRWKDLAADDLDQARRLTDWLWANRCTSDRPGAVQRN